jgi:hypothetical protein
VGGGAAGRHRLAGNAWYRPAQGLPEQDGRIGASDVWLPRSRRPGDCAAVARRASRSPLEMVYPGYSDQSRLHRSHWYLTDIGSVGCPAILRQA